MCLKNLEGKPERKNSKRTISASGGLGLEYRDLLLNQKKSFSLYLLLIFHSSVLLFYGNWFLFAGVISFIEFGHISRTTYKTKCSREALYRGRYITFRTGMPDVSLA